MKIISIVIILSLSIEFGITQNISHQDNFVQRHYLAGSFGYILERIDTLLGDTTRYYSKTDRYVEISKEGVYLVDGYKWGGMGTPCGCELERHGYWIERYRDGQIKQQGQYYCKRKIGTWIYYYENGQISKIENFKEAYIEMFTSYLHSSDPLPRHILHDGPYLEYYPNGNLKVSGSYVIVEEFSKTDTVSTFDAETYEEIIKVVEGEFWIPKSIKARTWNYYKENGEFDSQDEYQIEIWRNDTIRSIESRYWEMIYKSFKINDKE